MHSHGLFHFNSMFKQCLMFGYHYNEAEFYPQPTNKAWSLIYCSRNNINKRSICFGASGNQVNIWKKFHSLYWKYAIKLRFHCVKTGTNCFNGKCSVATRPPELNEQRNPSVFTRGLPNICMINWFWKTWWLVVECLFCVISTCILWWGIINRKRKMHKQLC